MNDHFGGVGVCEVVVFTVNFSGKKMRVELSRIRNLFTVAPALNLVWPHFCQEKNAFLRQFEPFICLTKLPQFLILHIFCRNDMVRCIILCSKLYLSIIKSNAVAIYIPAALFVLSSHKHQRH